MYPLIQFHSAQCIIHMHNRVSTSSHFYAFIFLYFDLILTYSYILPVPHVTYSVSPNTVSFCTVHNTHAQQGKYIFSFLCIHFPIFWSHFNLFVYFNTGPFIADWAKHAPIILNTATPTCIFIIAQHTMHNHNQACSKQRTTHTQKHDMLPQHQR